MADVLTKSDAPTLEERAATYQEYWEQTTLNPAVAPLHRQMGLRIVQLLPCTVLSMELNEAVRGFYPGSVHGGILATFADVASATALWKSVDETNIPVTQEMHLRFYRQPRGGPLTATVDVVHEGHRLLSTECVVRDVQERVLIRTSGTFALQPRRPSR